MKNTILFGAYIKTDKIYNIIKKDYNIIGITDTTKNLEKYNGSLIKIKIEDLSKIENLQIIIITSYVAKAITLLLEHNIKNYIILEHSMDNKTKKDFIKTIYVDFNKYKDLSIKNNKVCLINTNYSGSSTLSMYKNIPEQIKSLLDIKLLDKNHKNEEYFYDLITCNLTIGTQGPIDHIEGKKSIECWHGFPLKGISLMDKSRTNYDNWNKKGWNDIDFFLSYSELYSTFMNAGYAQNVNKYILTGMPRNDFLFKNKKRKLLEKTTNLNLKEKKIILYVPTFRDSYNKRDVGEKGNKNWNNFWGFNSYDNKSFNEFLEKNNLLLIIKLHPFEEEIREDKVIKFQTNNIYFLKDKQLYENKIDLYEFLNLFDLLITDYSSIYYDYLLLDNPIIFNAPDLDYYSNIQRGLVVDYESFTPGPKIYNQNELQTEIIKCIKNKDYYKNEREFMKKVCHKYIDGNSSKRTWDFIYDYLKI
jgi:CDP-glycerol glycerophosphotransferase (TagB/SpsB family)